MKISTLRVLYLAIALISSAGMTAKEPARKDGAKCEAERSLCKKISFELDRINHMPSHVAIDETCNHVRKVCEGVRDDINQLQGTGLLAPQMYKMYRACMPLLNGNVCGGAATAEQDPKVEIDAGRILWQPRSNEIKYLGKVLKVLPPRTKTEGWEHDYAHGNGTVGTRSQTLMLVYRFKEKPTNWQEALLKVGLPTGVPPIDFGASFIWPARGIKRQTITFRGRVLNRVILAKDFSEITIDGHEAGTY